MNVPPDQDRIVAAARQSGVDKLITHLRYGYKIYVLEDGRIVESGTHDELIRCNGTYMRLFETQAQYYRFPHKSMIPSASETLCAQRLATSQITVLLSIPFQTSQRRFVA